MAVPFRRTSKTKKRMRRTHLKKNAPSIVLCNNCGEALAPHRACTNCGYYKGKEVIEVATKE
ncbi:MAG: 50S ribosomal protein L32 [Bacilli bacterium]|nr:50S ribosomal protein L32 [Bacilli bacterium]